MLKPKQNLLGVYRNMPRYKYFAYAAFLCVAIAAAVTTYVVQKKHALISSAVVVPTAYASDLPGWWYKQYFGASICTTHICLPNSDPDGDGLTNEQEYYYHTDPLN